MAESHRDPLIEITSKEARVGDIAHFWSNGPPCGNLHCKILAIEGRKGKPIFVVQISPQKKKKLPAAKIKKILRRTSRHEDILRRRAVEENFREGVLSKLKEKWGEPR